MKNACCERDVPSSNRAQDGQRWTCPRCSKVWEHVCDEAEGCSWDLVYTPPVVTLVGNVKNRAAHVPLPSPRRRE
jgi:hypothetical protein